MEKLRLNTEKIITEMRRLDAVSEEKINKSWLAKQLGIKPPTVTHIFQKRPLSYADRVSKIFGCDAKDFVIAD